MNNDFLAEVIAEIFEERTTIHCDFGPLYFKHFNHLESIRILAQGENFKQEAISRGIETEEERLQRLYDDKLWSEEDEKFLQERFKFIERLNEGLSKIPLPSKREEHKKLIDYETKKIKEKEAERIKLLGLTAEKFSENKINKLFFDAITFLDKDFKVPAIDHLDYEDLDKELEIRKAQKQFFEKFNDTNISTAVLSSTFSPYLPFVEDVFSVFGEPMRNLTAFQIKVMSYGRTFLNIFKNAQKKIPDYVAKDPEALLQWAENQNSPKKETKIQERDDRAQAVFGAKKSDIEQIKKDDETAIELSQAVKEKGGAMNMQDLMDLHGV